MNEIENFPSEITDDEIKIEIKMTVNGLDYGLHTIVKDGKDKSYSDIADDIDRVGKMLTRSCSGLFRGKEYFLERGQYETKRT